MAHGRMAQQGAGHWRASNHRHGGGGGAHQPQPAWPRGRNQNRCFCHGVVEHLVCLVVRVHAPIRRFARLGRSGGGAAVGCCTGPVLRRCGRHLLALARRTPMGGRFAVCRHLDDGRTGPRTMVHWVPMGRHWLCPCGWVGRVDALAGCVRCGCGGRLCVGSTDFEPEDRRVSRGCMGADLGRGDGGVGTGQRPHPFHGALAGVAVARQHRSRSKIQQRHGDSTGLAVVPRSMASLCASRASSGSGGGARDRCARVAAAHPS